MLSESHVHQNKLKVHNTILDAVKACYCVVRVASLSLFVAFFLAVVTVLTDRSSSHVPHIIVQRTATKLQQRQQVYARTYYTCGGNLASGKMGDRQSVTRKCEICMRYSYYRYCLCCMYVLSGGGPCVQAYMVNISAICLLSSDDANSNFLSQLGNRRVLTVRTVSE